MAQFYSIQMSPTGPYPVSGPGFGGRSLHVARGEFNLGTQSAGTLAVADTIKIMRLHRNFRVEGGWVKTTGLGAGVTITVGDAGNTSRYFASAAAATAGTNTTLADTGRDYLTPAFTDVIVTIAGATTAATGQLIVTLFGSAEEPA